MVVWRSGLAINEMRTVLIISQGFEIASIWESLFKQKNCFVIVEKTPHAALQAAQLLLPALIILDLELPEQECLALCHELHAITSGKLLLLNPAGDAQNVFDYYSAGVNEILSPPVDHMTLLVKSMAWLVQQEWDLPKTNIVRSQD